MTVPARMSGKVGQSSRSFSPHPIPVGNICGIYDEGNPVTLPLKPLPEIKGIPQ